MKIASTFFAVVTCLCALVALGFSAILFSARNDKVIRADIFAQTIADMVKTLDEGSGTTNANDLTFKPGDAVKPATGTLSNTNFINAKEISGIPAAKVSFHKKILAKPAELSYKNFQETLKKAIVQTQKIIEQRDRMAEEIFNACNTLEIPDALKLNQDNLKMLSLNEAENSPYVQELNKINQFAIARKTRDVFLRTSLITIGKTLGVEIDPNKFTQLNDQGKYDLETEVNQVLDLLAKLKTRDEVITERLTQYVSEFKDNLRQLGSKNRIFMSVDPETFATTEYSTALNLLRKDFEDIVTKLGEMNPLVTEIALVNSRISTLEEQNRANVAILNNRDALINHVLKMFPPSQEDLRQGKILTVNVEIPILEKGYAGANLASWSAELGFGVVNKGRLDGIVRGMLFVIYKTDVNGQPKPIGQIRISDVRENDARGEFVQTYVENHVNEIIGDEQLIYTGEIVDVPVSADDLEELDFSKTK